MREGLQDEAFRFPQPVAPVINESGSGGQRFPRAQRSNSGLCDPDFVAITLDQSLRSKGAEIVVESSAAGGVAGQNRQLHLASALRVLG